MEQFVLSSETSQTRSVKRAADIIHVLGSSAEGRKLTDIANEVGLSKATTYRILQTLVSEKLVDYQEEDGTYFIGAALVRIAMASRATTKLAIIRNIEKISAPYMRELCDSTGETVALVVSHGNVRTNLVVNLGSYELIASPKIGAQLPLYVGGPGKDDKLHDFFDGRA
jgi:DNA-binding IclR family transcriptional regulator